MRGLWESPHATQIEVEHRVLIPTQHIDCVQLSV